MRIALPLALLLATSACSDKIKTEGLGDLPVDSIAFSDSYRGSVSLGDRSLDVRNIVLSDQANLCADIDGVGLDGMSDVFAVAVTAVSTGDASNVESNASFGTILGESSVTRGFIAARIIERRGGETVYDARSVNTVDIEAITRGDFGINSVSSGPNGYKFGGSFELDIGADFTDPSAYDVDVTDDDSPDFEGVNGSVKGRFTGAAGCEALASDLSIGDGGGGGDCSSERFDNPNPDDSPFLKVEFGEVCAGVEDRMTYNVGSGCTTRLDVTVPNAYDQDGALISEVDLGLFYAGGGGTDPTNHSRRTAQEGNDYRVYLEGGGDSFGAVTARVSHVRGADPVDYTLNVVVDCP